MQINLLDEIIVDNFAGGGGASTGIELATGRPVDIAINHDPDAILMHQTNHPYTEHYQESVWDVDPVEICRGRKVGLAWFSPDCKHFSKAKGGKPVDKNIRGLAWIVLKWAGTVRPRVIILENVEEFQTWGPVRKGKPVKSKQGETFRRWLSQLRALGYEVEYKELKACDYGAPTIRKRFFLVARCDGKEIVFPEPTHAPSDSEAVKSGLLKPYKSAADCIDFDLPCPSIFTRKKPLVENTRRRIARGLDKFVIKGSNSYVVSGEYGLILPALIQYHSETGKSNVRGQKISIPLMTVDSTSRYGVFLPFLSKYFGGVVGADVRQPAPTVTAIDHNSLCMPFLTQYYSGADHANSVGNPLQTVTVQPRHFLCKSYLAVLRNNMDAKSLQEPLPTVTTSAGHFANIKVCLRKYRKGIFLGCWDKVREMLNKYTEWNIADDEVLVFIINGIEYFISDIGLRMLQPRELYKAQGFPDDYIIEKDYTGKAYPKAKQVARCGNAVPPPFAAALVRANLPEWCGDEIATMEQLNERIAV